MRHGTRGGESDFCDPFRDSPLSDGAEKNVAPGSNGEAVRVGRNATVRVFNASPYPFEYKTAGASGIDLHAAISMQREIAPGVRWVFGTGIYLELPPGLEGQVRPRSGLTRDFGLMAMLGTIDSDYRGEIGVVLVNLGQQSYTVSPGDRIAQLVIAPVCRAEIELVGERSDLSLTARGARGFGSTGR